MKILHITYDMRIGGTEMVIKNIIEGNRAKNCVMSIFCLEEPLGPWGKDLAESGIKISTYSRKDGFDVDAIRALKKYIKKENIDILHCHQYTPWVYGALASIGTSVSVIFTEHGRFYPDTKSWKRRFINPILTTLTDEITSISYATKAALKDFEYIPEKQIKVIYNGINGLTPKEEEIALLQKELGITKNTVTFGTIARLDPIKNHELMLRAFAKTVQSCKNSRLIIVGDGELMSHLQALAKSLGIDQHVIFTGYISYPANYLAVFDIFLLSSLSEGTSMTLLEAMSLSKPCIVTDAGGNKEIIENGVNGIVTPNNDVDQFSLAMSTLINEPEKRKAFGKNSLVRFEQLFNVEIMSHNYQLCYEGLA